MQSDLNGSRVHMDTYSLRYDSPRQAASMGVHLVACWPEVKDRLLHAAAAKKAMYDAIANFQV